MNTEDPVRGAIYFMDKWGIAIGMSTFVRGQVGIITTRAFSKGEHIFSVRGTLVDAPTRYSFAFNANQHIEPERLNGTFNPGHFLNHSCDPSVVVVPTLENGLPVIAVVARHDIGVGTELAFDYATLEYDVTAAGIPCECDTALCRGVMGGFRDLPESVKKRYEEEGGIVAPHLLELDREK